MEPASTRVIAWQRQHGRHGLPWQGADAYRVWISEIMLQQTQVTTVIPYFQRFIERFPNLKSLAAAGQEEVLALWSGLGYYARGRNLHRAARLVAEHHGAEFPSSFNTIISMPGIGRSTAAAICVLAFNQRHAILDGNVKRVLARYRGVKGYPGRSEIESQLWDHAEALLPDREVARYTQGIMDLGALVCTRSNPACADCPLQPDCVAFQTGQTSNLPTPRPRKVVPERKISFLIVLNGADVLLEKRPVKGFWGGMYCPPTFEQEGVADEAGFSQLDVSETAWRAIPAFKHCFTHFILHVSPYVTVVNRRRPWTREAGRVWMNFEAALESALPAPVRRMLLKLPERGPGGG